jgi:hypothetical protein
MPVPSVFPSKDSTQEIRQRGISILSGPGHVGLGVNRDRPTCTNLLAHLRGWEMHDSHPAVCNRREPASAHSVTLPQERCSSEPVRGGQ